VDQVVKALKRDGVDVGKSDMEKRAKEYFRDDVADLDEEEPF
jgi:hypothetical protein